MDGVSDRVVLNPVTVGESSLPVSNGLDDRVVVLALLCIGAVVAGLLYAAINFFSGHDVEVGGKDAPSDVDVEDPPQEKFTLDRYLECVPREVKAFDADMDDDVLGPFDHLKLRLQVICDRRELTQEAFDQLAQSFISMQMGLLLNEIKRNIGKVNDPCLKRFDAYIKLRNALNVFDKDKEYKVAFSYLSPFARTPMRGKILEAYRLLEGLCGESFGNGRLTQEEFSGLVASYICSRSKEAPEVESKEAWTFIATTLGIVIEAAGQAVEQSTIGLEGFLARVLVRENVGLCLASEQEAFISCVTICLDGEPYTQAQWKGLLLPYCGAQIAYFQTVGKVVGARNLPFNLSGSINYCKNLERALSQ
ncbi:hypothetical protein K0U07_03045 [bacterium]|nr:hypothetical protein [bacterium]